MPEKLDDERRLTAAAQRHAPHAHPLAARARPRRRRRLPRPRQRRQQHDRRRQVRLPAGVGRRAGNVMAWLIQYLSAKLGIVTGKSLPRLLGVRIRNRWARRAYWLQAELVAMATDIAEVIGGAVALNLLFDLPAAAGAASSPAPSRWCCSPCRRGAGRARSSSSSSACSRSSRSASRVGVFIAPPDAGSVARRHWCRASRAPDRCCSRHPSSAPRSCRTRSTPTRALARDRFEVPTAIRRTSTHRSALHLDAPTRWDVSIAMLIAGTVNLCILLLAAANLAGRRGHRQPRGRIRGARGRHRHRSSRRSSRSACSPSGLASTSVGAYAGAEIMHGLLHVRVPLLARRLVTLIPALLILGIGFDPTSRSC